MPVTRNKFGRLLGATLLAMPLLATWYQPYPAWWLTAVPVGILLVSAWRPLYGALTLAGLAPLAPLINLFVARPWGANETAEILILATLSGAWFHFALKEPAPTTSLSRPAAALGLVAGASVIVLLSVQQLSTLRLPSFIWALGGHVVQDYFISPRGFGTVHHGMVLIEGLLVAALFERLARADATVGPRLLRMLVIGAAGAAACSANRLLEISLRTPAPAREFVQFLLTIRIAPLYGDINAAGSYFAMMTVPAAIWWAARRPRLGGTTALLVLRWLCWTAMLALVVLALWLTFSRAAFLATFAGAALALVVQQTVSWRKILTWGAAVAAVLVIVTFWNLRPLASSASPWAMRMASIKISLRMFADYPFFGVGIGQFRSASLRYVDTEIIRVFPLAVRGENAHNNFLQFLGELGLAGLAAFMWLLWTALRPAIQHLRNRPAASSPQPGENLPPELPLVAATGGVLAFLISCLAGHPLLTPQVSWAFFAMLGLTAGLASRQKSSSPAPSLDALSAADGIRLGRPRSRVALMALTVLFVTLPYRVYVARAAADLDHVAIGVDKRVMAEDGVIYQLADQHSTWFVSVRAKGVEMPLRLTTTSVPPCRVEIGVDGRPGNVVEPRRGEWQRVAFALMDAPRGAAAHRIDLGVIGDDCHLMVGHLVEHE
jgi:hypothetical protein